MDVWTFIWLMVFLKIPIVALFLLVRWAIRQEPEAAPNEDGGIGTRERGPRHPHHPRPPLPRNPRRGPHRGTSAPTPPRRIRALTARARVAPR